MEWLAVGGCWRKTGNETRRAPPLGGEGRHARGSRSRSGPMVALHPTETGRRVTSGQAASRSAPSSGGREPRSRSLPLERPGRTRKRWG